MLARFTTASTTKNFYLRRESYSGPGLGLVSSAWPCSTLAESIRSLDRRRITRDKNAEQMHYELGFAELYEVQRYKLCGGIVLRIRNGPNVTWLPCVTARLLPATTNYECIMKHCGTAGIWAECELQIVP